MINWTKNKNEMKATRINKGQFQVVDITYNQDGTSIVKGISEWYPIPASIRNSPSIPTSAELTVGTKYESLF